MKNLNFSNADVKPFIFLALNPDIYDQGQGGSHQVTFLFTG
jgi:hypothetical protein